MIAIFTENADLRRMLALEVARSGLPLAPTEKEATLLLLDLDHPQKITDGSHHAVTVGFSAHVREQSTDFLLPLPYPTAQLQELLRRYGSPGEISRGMQPLAGGVLLLGRRISLSPSEERLFRVLYAERGNIVSEARLKEALADCGGESNVLQVLLSRLRRKLAPDGFSRIRAVRCQGYLLMDESR